MDKKKRFIEETFPVKEVSVESAREKNIRHGHISTLHIWWARRPLASSRATNYAALIPASDNIDEWKKKRQFIIDFSKWENYLTLESREKKLLDGFLAGRERLKEEVKKKQVQRSLFE
jgi:putative DNA methylase